MLLSKNGFKHYKETIKYYAIVLLISDISAPISPFKSLYFLDKNFRRTQKFRLD